MCVYVYTHTRFTTHYIFIILQQQQQKIKMLFASLFANMFVSSVIRRFVSLFVNMFVNRLEFKHAYLRRLELIYKLKLGSFSKRSSLK